MKKTIKFWSLYIVTLLFISCQNNLNHTNRSNEEQQDVFLERAFHGRDGEFITLKSGTVVKKVDSLYIYNGDIVLSEKQVNILDSVAATKSVVLKSVVSKWSTGKVPYVISANYSSHEMALIEQAILAFHRNTCIRFIPRYNETDYIIITGEDTGCWSSVGRIGGQQAVNLQPGGCFGQTPGTIIHELSHAIGVLHEHSRPDRDEYIKIHWENIQPSLQGNFQIATFNNTGTYGPFDFGSVMLYSPTAFGNGKQTISRVDGLPYSAQRNGFSTLDIAGINALYNCQ